LREIGGGLDRSLVISDITYKALAEKEQEKWENHIHTQTNGKYREVQVASLKENYRDMEAYHQISLENRLAL
jgi:hypothetical protein